jgi:hypothetical protein
MQSGSVSKVKVNRKRKETQIQRKVNAKQTQMLRKQSERKRIGERKSPGGRSSKFRSRFAISFRIASQSRCNRFLIASQSLFNRFAIDLQTTFNSCAISLPWL